ncbi:hypothetical protein BGC07_15885 [Piscirickettsia litoralis]|uniref:DUF4158 domain-containing protein n=2 Tax=Piscirickettsia litoralis TaxID=1891921 RepID=A0ABX2ZZC6_9GAMM|nr:hypothetical protein BGC07_15885 [Piscirickettsia litoralis]
MINLRTPNNKVFFLVASGYFKARRKFFGWQFRQSDIQYVALQIGVNLDEITINAYSKESYARHQRIILNYFGFKAFDLTAKNFIIKEITTLIRVQFRPKLIMLESIETLIRHNIALPSYNVLADLIITEINHQRVLLGEIVDGCLSENQRQKLDDLLEKEPNDKIDGGWRYRLTLLKKPYQSTQPTKIRANLSDLNILQTLYLDLKTTLSQLNLSSECIRYYAYSVIKSQIPQVSRRADAE